MSDEDIAREIGARMFALIPAIKANLAAQAEDPHADLIAVVELNDARWFLEHPDRYCRLRRFIPHEMKRAGSYTIAVRWLPDLIQRFPCLFIGGVPADDDAVLLMAVMDVLATWCD